MNTPDEELIAILAATEHYNADGVGRGARLENCIECGRRVLVGLDAERCALAARTDPHEIDELGEFLALRIGLVTYNLTQGFSTKGTRRWELSPRMLPHLEAPRRSAVVAAHRCGMQLPRSKRPWPNRTFRPPRLPAGAAPSF